MSQPSTIDALFRNNDEPSEEAVEEVRKLLIGPTKELKVLDAEILQYEKHLEELKVKRERVSETITRYSTILSPIRRIPVDVLHEIFSHCLARHNPAILATEAPILLTHVCHSWRSIALSSPRLWARLHITFTDEDLEADIEPHNAPWRREDPGLGFPKARIIQILRLRCKAIEEWLRLSGTCPLSISIFYSSNLVRDEDGNDPEISDITSHLLKLLANVSERWMEIDITMPFHVYRRLGDIITVSQLRLLTTLRLTLRREWIASAEELQAILKVPNLKRLSVDVKLPEITPTWNLTTISLSVTLSVLDASSLLRKCPALVCFKASLSANGWNSAAPISSQDPISLPHLRVLCINDNVQYDLLGNFYGSINAPELTWVTYIRWTRYASGFNHNPADNFSAVPITDLFRTSVKLQTLTIEANQYTNQEMREMFRSVPTVTHLILGQRLRFDDLTPSWQHSSRSNMLWDFGRLFVGNTPVEAQEAHLLPNLERLEVSSLCAAMTSLSDETLLKFIIDRMTPVTSYLSSPLTYVSVVFRRQKSLDIEEHVLNHAESFAITSKIKLDLRYNESADQIAQRQRTHPGYGLNSHYGPPWHLRDLDEEMIFS